MGKISTLKAINFRYLTIMLKHLRIQNFALIEETEVRLNDGLTVITGETGAGKSILLGALGLTLGARTDINSLHDKTKKCIIEAQFNIKEYQLHSFFEKNELDFEEITSIRREITPEGKSRAFINDTPTTLSVLKELGEQSENSLIPSFPNFNFMEYLKIVNHMLHYYQINEFYLYLIRFL